MQNWNIIKIKVSTNNNIEGNTLLEDYSHKGIEIIPQNYENKCIRINHCHKYDNMIWLTRNNKEKTAYEYQEYNKVD